MENILRCVFNKCFIDNFFNLKNAIRLVSKKKRIDPLKKILVWKKNRGGNSQEVPKTTVKAIFGLENFQIIFFTKTISSPN